MIIQNSIVDSTIILIDGKMIYFLDKKGLLSLPNRTLWEVNCIYYDICACNANTDKNFNSPPFRCSNCTVRSAV